MSLISNNSRGTTFPEHLQRSLRSTPIASCMLEFSHAREARNKEGLQDFGGFGRRVCEGYVRARGWGEGRVGRATMSRDPHAHCAVSPFSSPDSPARFCRQCEKRSWRDPGGIPWVESIEVSPRTLYPLAFSCLPRLLLHLSLFSSSLVVSSSFYCFLSFNLRLDCRLHIALFYGFCRSIFNFSSIPRCLSVFFFLLFSFHSLRSKFNGLIYNVTHFSANLVWSVQIDQKRHTGFPLQSHFALYYSLILSRWIARR